MEREKTGCSTTLLIVIGIILAIVIIVGVIYAGIKIWPVFILVALFILYLLFSHE